MTGVVACDPSSVFRAGIKCVLSACPDLRLDGEAEDFSELLTLARSTRCDVVIAEIAQAKNFWTEFLSQLHAARPLAAVLIFSALPESIYGVHALRAGASGFLDKQCPRGHLIDAVRTVASGKKYVSRLLAEELAGALGSNGSGRPCDMLSTRELQILRMLAQGRSVSQIAADIVLSVKTVSTYRSRILEKTRLANNAELMRYALLQNIV